MKRSTWLCLLITVLAIGALAAVETKKTVTALNVSQQLSGGSLAILAPKSGEEWNLGTIREIRWTPGQFAGNGHIDLSKLGGGHAGNLEINVPLAGGSWKWKVGTMKTGSLVPTGNGYKICIVDAADGKMLGMSQGTFTIAPAQPLAEKTMARTNQTASAVHITSLAGGTLAILAPKSGEEWDLGMIREIRWTPGQLAGNGHIDLSKLGGGHAGNLEINVPLAGGSWKWKVGTMKTGSLAPTGNGYKICIVDAADGKMLGTSPGTFTIAPAQPVLHVIKSSAYKKKID